MVGVSALHEMVIKGHRPLSLNFATVKTGSLTELVKGKRKKGGIKVSAGGPLCEVVCADETSYKLHSPVDGFIIEVNENVLNDPKLMISHPESKGFIAIVQTPLSKVGGLTKALTPEEIYLRGEAAVPQI
eukprot:TRINITY_DN4469_c0_g3_i2.p1 TRINITY_DN4469_c0_g3~~TRINITY_DN4469_c0_g3_i2.p1  ORF type:complete len:130 (-),score=24.76 TRINITY_DN4469_c0_g3_i2:107-496(-)